jgi:hypothetical protein
MDHHTKMEKVEGEKAVRQAEQECATQLRAHEEEHAQPRRGSTFDRMAGDADWHKETSGELAAGQAGLKHSSHAAKQMGSWAAAGAMAPTALRNPNWEAGAEVGAGTNKRHVTSWTHKMQTSPALSRLKIAGNMVRIGVHFGLGSKKAKPAAAASTSTPTPAPARASNRGQM